MVDKVLTYNRETEWAAAQAVVKPDQSQGTQQAPSCRPLLSQEGRRHARNLPPHFGPLNNFKSYHLWGDYQGVLCVHAKSL